MAIPLNFLNRFAIPLVVAALYLHQDVDVAEQAKIFDKTMQLADKTLHEAKAEGENSTLEIFDFIIIGGGSAGSVLANRLSASGKKLLLLEAGGDPNPVLDIPYAHDIFWETRIMDWNYTTVKQNRSCLYNFDGHCWWPRGKSLGGTSAINIVLYNRCNPKDYALWANFTGDASWSWENVKEKYNQIEDYHGFYENETNLEHGKGGNVFVGKVEYLPGISVLKEALTEKNIPVGDLDGGSFHWGFSNVEYNIKDGMRWGTFKSHLEPVMSRSNLHIYRYATAQKILFNGTRAIGIEYERHGKVLTAMATQEIILSAGVVESPKLLMLSGIGPKGHLDSFNISTLVDLPVGQYLQDHPGMDIVGAEKEGFFLNTTFGMSMRNPKLVLEYLEKGTGPMSAFSSTPRLMKGYLNSTLNSDKDWPEVYMYVYERYKENGDGEAATEEIYFSLDLVQTTSSGTIKLASANPNEKPLIDPNFFADATDLERMVDVIGIMIDVFVNSTTYQKHGIKLFRPFEPCSETDFLSRDYWKCYIRQMAAPKFHSTSTCRMGPNSTVSVVDSKLRVWGTQALRVVDSSVIPFVPSGNTNMPTILVAERGSELILSENELIFKKIF